MNRVIWAGAMILLLGVGCAGDAKSSVNEDMEKLTLTTSDSVSIAADYYEAEGERFAILLHMMPATKESWEEFALELQKRGINSIAIDERGHGESAGGPNGFKEFTDAEQASKIEDVHAAWKELDKRGATKSNTVIIGASIGSNLAIVALGDQLGLSAGVALSPGLDYRSVMTESSVQALEGSQQLLIVTSREDEYSFLSSEKLATLNDRVEFWPQEGLGHGTTMFENDPALMNRVLDWIDSIY